jgi:hypothetical protein
MPCLYHLSVCTMRPIDRRSFQPTIHPSRPPTHPPTQPTNQPTAQLYQDVRAEHLKGMTGIQYLAEEVQGPRPDTPIFVIQKLLRSAPEQEPQVGWDWLV